MNNQLKEYDSSLKHQILFLSVIKGSHKFLWKCQYDAKVQSSYLNW